MLLLSGGRSVEAADPGLPDSLTIDSVVAYFGDAAIIPVRFSHDEELTAIEVTLKENGIEYAIDSFSLIGSRLSGVGFVGTTENPNGSITVFALATTVIPPGSGLLGRLYLSRPAIQSPVVIEIDTTTYSNPPFERSTTFTAQGSTTAFRPVVTKGYLQYLSAPLSLDSVVVDSVGVQPGGSVAVPVYLSNVEQLAGVSIALTYGSDDLILDSISFENTRLGSPFGLSSLFRDTDNSLIVMAQYGESLPLEPGSGVYFWLFFRAVSTAPASIISIDSTEFAPGAGVYVELLSANGGGRFIPRFFAGQVVIDVTTDVDDSDDLLPDKFILQQNYPNPFNPTTTIEFSLPEATTVHLAIYNVLGQEVATLIDGRLAAGVHTVSFRAESLGSGVYWYRLTADADVATRSMILLK